MNQLKKVLFALAIAAGLGLITASTASAQEAFQMSSIPRQVRIEGTAEAVAPVTLTATSGSAAPNQAVIKATSTVSLDYGTTIDTGNPQILSCNTANAPSATCGAGAGTAPTLAVSGSVLTITFTADSSFQAGDTINISGVRVNANTAVGTSILATGSTTVPATFAFSNPVSFFIVNQVAVASIQPKAVTVTITPAAPVLDCTLPLPFAVGTGPVMVIKVAENFNQAFTSPTDETGFGGAGAGAPIAANAQPMNIRFAFANIPVGLKLQAAPGGFFAVPFGSPIPTPTAGTTFTTFTSAAGAQSVNVDVFFTATATTGANEALWLNLQVTVPGTSLPVVTNVGTVTVSLVAAGASPKVPRFAANNQGSGNSESVQVCATYLLFPWTFVIRSSSGALLGDTGIAIANTTLDPAVIGTVGQTGAVNLYLFPINNDGSPGTAPPAGGVLPPSRIASPLAAGGVAAFNLSELVTTGNFLGYMIAVCNFQLGHGTGFYSNPSVPGQGAAFQAAVITNPRLFPGGFFEGAGQ